MQVYPNGSSTGGNGSGGSAVGGIDRQIMQVNPNGSSTGGNGSGGSAVGGIDRQIMQVNPNGSSTGGGGTSTAGTNPGLPIDPPGGPSTAALQAMLQRAASAATAFQNMDVDPSALGSMASVSA
jgi:hypothetical protein